MILDTDILIAAASRRCPPRITRELAAVAVPVYTTAINWAELCYGIEHEPLPDRTYLYRRYESVVFQLVQVLAFDQECAEICAHIRVELDRNGRPLELADVMIASVALRHNMLLISGNVRHFGRVPGLKLENWFEVEG